MSGYSKNMLYPVEDKAASYTLVAGDVGKLLVSTAAITFTLPPIADVPSGWNVKLFAGSNDTMTVTAPTGKLVTFNNAAATTIAGSTSAEKAGWGVEIVYDGTLTKYLALLHTEETATITVS